MKIKVQELKDALTAVKPGLASKEIIDQTTSFAFTDNKVISYNDEICIMCPLELDGLTGAVKAEELYNFLKKVKTEEIDLDIEENQALMKSGRARVGFTLASKILLPIEDELSVNSDWNKLPEKFNEALKFGASCASEDMSNAKLTCVHINNTGIIEAADMFRIIRFKLGKKLKMTSTLIPANSVKEVIKLRPTKVADGNGWVHFKNDSDVVISCRTFDEQYVNIDAILNRKQEQLINFTFPDKTLEILDRASVFTKVQAKQSNEETIEVSVKDKVLRIECQTDTSWFKESVPVKSYKGSDFAFSITPYLLQDILNGNKECTLTKDMLRFETEDWVYLSSLKGNVKQ